MKTTSAYVTGPYCLEYIEEELPALGPHDVLIHTDAVGLCHTDLPIFQYRQGFGYSSYGYRENQLIKKPRKFGHEPVGTIVQVGDQVSKFAVGDHVAGYYQESFTTYRVLPEDALLIKIPEIEGVDYRYCLIEPMGCVTNILDYMRQDEMNQVGVVGCGYMNLMMISALKSIGVPRVFAVDIRDDKLELAKKYGADVLVNSTKCDIAEKIFLETGGTFLDSVVEMSGSVKGLETASAMIKYTKQNGSPDGKNQGRGRIVITSVYSREEIFPAELASNLVLRCPILDSAHPMSTLSFAENYKVAMDMYVKREIPIDTMVSHTIPFDRMHEGMMWLENPAEDYIKGVVLFS